jgi:hypothetical protein
VVGFETALSPVNSKAGNIQNQDIVCIVNTFAERQARSIFPPLVTWTETEESYPHSSIARIFKDLRTQKGGRPVAWISGAGRTRLAVQRSTGLISTDAILSW